MPKTKKKSVSNLEIITMTENYVNNLPPIEFNENSEDYEAFARAIRALAKK